MNESRTGFGAAGAADWEFLHGRAASSDQVPWQSSKFHAEMWVCGRGTAGSAIAQAAGFSL
jgi:hypothetical protein